MEERFVVETNILYSFFWKNSPTHRLLHLAASKDVNLVSPQFALNELNKHREEILFASRIRPNEFGELIKLLPLLVEFVSESEYIEFLDEAKSIFPEHLKDVDFFALALKYDCVLWSNEKLHKRQSKVKVLNTDELRALLEKPKDDSKPEDGSDSEPE